MLTPTHSRDCVTNVFPFSKESERRGREKDGRRERERGEERGSEEVRRGKTGVLVL